MQKTFSFLSIPTACLVALCISICCGNNLWLPPSCYTTKSSAGFRSKTAQGQRDTRSKCDAPAGPIGNIVDIVASLFVYHHSWLLPPGVIYIGLYAGNYLCSFVLAVVHHHVVGYSLGLFCMNEILWSLHIASKCLSEKCLFERMPTSSSFLVHLDLCGCTAAWKQYNANFL